MTSTSRFFLIIFVLVSSVPSVFGGVADEDDIEFAMQNPFLRDLFRDRELRIAFGPFDRPSRRAWSPRAADDHEDFMLEMRIDQMVRVFLRKVIEEKQSLQAAMETTREAAVELRQTPSDAASGHLRQSLKDLADHASNLRATLASVISDLPEKAHFEPKLSDESKKDGFRTEIDFLSEQTRNAWDRVNAFFFRPGATVTVADLKGDDMMVSLHKIQLMAEKLAEAVQAP